MWFLFRAPQRLARGVVRRSAGPRLLYVMRFDVRFGSVVGWRLGQRLAPAADQAAHLVDEARGVLVLARGKQVQGMALAQQQAQLV